MRYKQSKYNYMAREGQELLIVNFKKGLSSFSVITEDDISTIEYYLSLENIDITEPDSIQDMLIKNGFWIPEDQDESREIELLQADYIYNTKLQLIIHVTKNCNFRCKYCFIDFENKKMEPLVQEQVVSFVRNNINKYSGVYVSWFGGEPLMGMDVIRNMSEKIINICKKTKKPYLAGITTNGFLLTPDTIRELIKNKVYSYCITLDGLKDSHDNQRVLANGNPTFDRIVDNLRYIKNAIPFKYLSICIRTNFTKTTLARIDEYISFFRNEFGDDKRFSLLVKLASDWGGDRIESIRNTLLNPSATKQIYEHIISHNNPLAIDNVTSLYFGGMTCNAVRRNKYTISSDGVISKCDTPCEETMVGHIDENGWHIDSAKEAQWLMAYKEHSTSECTSCLFKCMCFQGACPKKKLNGMGRTSCPKPVFASQLIQIYKKMAESHMGELL